MQLLFHLQPEKLRIILEENDAEKSVTELDDMRALSQTLLLAIDELLRRNGLEVADLESVKMQSTLSPNFTSYRIVEATVKSLTIKI